MWGQALYWIGKETKTKVFPLQQACSGYNYLSAAPAEQADGVDTVQFQYCTIPKLASRTLGGVGAFLRAIALCK